MKQQGTLIFDRKLDRFQICFGENKYSNGLHCGSTMKVLINGKWEKCRLEMTRGEWYLVGLDCEDLNGLVVKPIHYAP